MTTLFLVGLAILFLVIFCWPKDPPQPPLPKPVPYRRLPHHERKAMAVTSSPRPKPKVLSPVQQAKTAKPKIAPASDENPLLAASIMSYASYTSSYEDNLSSSDKGAKDNGPSFDSGGGDFGGGGASGSYD